MSIGVQMEYCNPAISCKNSSKVDCPLAFVQQLQDPCQMFLAEECDDRENMDLIGLVEFVIKLPERKLS